jgi:hypothetical protein
MSNLNNSTILNPGVIINDIHYGPLASYWWYNKIDRSTKSQKLYPIKLHLRMHHTKNGIEFYTSIVKGKNNRPEYCCSAEEISENSDNMTTAVTEVYQKCLEKYKGCSNNTKLDGPCYFGMGNEDHLRIISAEITFTPFYIQDIQENNFKMFVVDASHDGIEPLDGYHITFIQYYKRKSTLFSQFYSKNQFHVNLYSIKTGERLVEYQNSDVNELWKSIGLFNMFTGAQLFLLENIELKQIIDDLSRFEVDLHQWNAIIFEKLHQTYMKNINSKELTMSVFNHLHHKKSSLFEFYNLLNTFEIIEKHDMNLDENILRKIRAWKRLLNASGCKQIKTDKNNEYWSKANDIGADLETLQLFSEINSKSEAVSESDKDLKLDSQAEIFWKCFEDALNSNIRGSDGERRILSIIADKFSYSILNEKLKISNNLIRAARIHARLYGSGAPILAENRVKMTRKLLSDEQLGGLETYLHDKNNVTMSSYYTDPATGMPILYLRAPKKEMWEKYHEEYPNGLKRTSFMCRLDGQFKYKEDLGGLCIICDFYGYQVFDSLVELINNSQLYVTDKNNFLNKIDSLKRHLKRGLDEEIKVLQDGSLQHTTCLNHCLLYAFGECKEKHDLFCKECTSLFVTLNEIKALDIINTKEFEECQDKLLYYLSHQLRKIYLNSQFNAALRGLKKNGAVLVCDYKMKVNPKSSRETKSEFFGKEGWTLHTILVITKSNDNSNELIIRAFDHWSDDGKQDAWFTASAFDAVLSKIEKDDVEYIRIFSDNGGHYHNSELMVIVSYWKKWYNLNVASWQFLEPGEAKTIVDSHHAKLSHGFIRYTKLGNSIYSGEDIVNANKDLAGTHFAKLIPDRSKKVSVNTIPGISNYFTFMWPIGEQEGIIKAYEIPNYGSPKIYTIFDIKKLLKNNDVNQPNPITIEQSVAAKEWKINVPSEIHPSVQYSKTSEIRSSLNENKLDPSGEKIVIKQRWNQFYNHNFEDNLFTPDNDLENFLYEKLIPGFALKSSQKLGKRGSGKRLDIKVIEKLKGMFLAGNIEKSNKFSPEDMLKNLNQCVENDELEASNIPTLQQIKSWITRFNQYHKKRAAEDAK